MEWKYFYTPSGGQVMEKWIDDQLSNFSVFERTSDVIKLIHQQAADKYDEQLESLHQLYNKL